MNIKKLFTNKRKINFPIEPLSFIELLGLPACIIDPLNDRFLQYNGGFKNLFPFLERLDKPSRCFPNQYAELIAFTQAIECELGAETTDLKFVGPDNGKITCLVQGSLIQQQPSAQYLFIIIPETLLQETRALHDANESLRGGLLEWRRLKSLYSHAESINNLVLNAAGDGIFGVDIDGITTFVNPAAEVTLGWSEHDLIGQKMHDLIHHHHSSGTFYPHTECPIYRAFRHGVVERVDNEVFWHKSGTPVPVEYTSTPIYSEDKVQGAVIVFRDISERLESQNALKHALEEVDALKQRFQNENEYLRTEVRAASNHSHIIGSSLALKKIIQQIEIVAATEANVLITGESGTGKELIAQAIHDASPRQDQALIRVNCAAIPKDLFESEFFGHIKGAFSGAISERLGRFELANGGTLFLDEVGEIPIDLQGKLLRVLQERKYERVGEGVSRETDVRIITATNRDLREEVKLGNFREDLFFRLDVFPIHSPPLRERIEDIPELVNHFVESACLRLNVARPLIDAKVIRELQTYPWPGNARELQNVVERSIILAQGGRLTFNMSPTESAHSPANTLQQQTIKPTSLSEISDMERDLIMETLKDCSGRVSGPFGAAQKLGVKPTTLYSRLNKYKN